MLNIDVSSLIRSKIDNEGPITIREFLNHVLKVQNEHYSVISSVKRNKPVEAFIFREILADWCINFWEANKKPKNLKVIIFSPKNGDLIATILTQKNAEFVASISIYIVEPNSYFEKLQKQSLKNHSNKIAWVDDFEKIPNDAPSITIAKKFFSSLPIDQYTRKKGEWLVNVVDLGPSRLHFCISHVNKLNDNISQYLDSRYSHIQDGGIIELHDEATMLLKKILYPINKFGGCVLLVDYGYIEHKERPFISTLQAINNKRWSPIFSRLGRNFLSAHLNFSNIKEIIELSGLQVHGPIAQKDFLSNMKIEEKKAENLRMLPEYKHGDILAEHENLTSPDRLGDLFKVMSICNKSSSVAGF